MIKKVAILTSGGDSPGMNNAIRSIVKQSIVNKIEPFLVFEGYKGLYEGNIKPAKNFDVDSYISKGGTFIYSSRFPEFKDLEIRKVAKNQLDKMNIDALVVIGGDGSYKGAQLLHELGVKTITIPGTIDNDITSTDFTIGYDSALNAIVENIERLKDTALSHNRAIIVEVMGRHCGDLAIFSALATGAQLVVTNENKKSIEEIAFVIKEQSKKEKRGIIIIVLENIFNDINYVSQKIEEISKITTRGVVLGHIQRGGIPSPFEKILATQMGFEAIQLLIKGKSGFAISSIDNKIQSIPILKALSIPRINRTKLINEINKLNQA